MKPRAAGATAEDALGSALGGFAATLSQRLPGVVADEDPEDVHQSRVACRRLRSTLRTYRPLFDTAWADRWHDRLGELAATLGAVRDADVLDVRLRARIAEALDAEEAHDAERLVVTLEEHRDAALRVLVEDVTSPAMGHLLAALRAEMTSPPVRPEVRDGGAAAVLRPAARQAWRRLRSRARRTPSDASDAELHALRITAKRCRYTAGTLTGVLGDAPRAAVAALGRLQDHLGAQHDAVVAATWLRAHGGGGFAAGILCGVELADAERLRREWPSAWRAAGKASLWKWL